MYKFWVDIKKIIIVIEIFLIAIVPLLIIGFDIFENTSFYKSVYGFYGVEKAINYRLTTQYGESHQQKKTTRR